MRISVYMERCNFVENIDIEDKSIPQELCNPIPALTFSKSVINGTFIICLLWILVLCTVNLIMTKVLFYLRKQTHPQFSFGSTPNLSSPNTHNLSRWRFHGFRSMELSTRLTVVSNGSNSIRVTETPFTAHVASNFYLCGQLRGVFPISWFNLEPGVRNMVINRCKLTSLETPGLLMSPINVYIRIIVDRLL